MTYQPLPINEESRVKVSTLPADIELVTGSITAIQPTIETPVAGGTVVADVSRASNLDIFPSGTFAGVNVTFEGSLEPTGDANWFAVQGVRTNANTIELTTGVLSAQPAYAWELSVNALSRFRVRATARTSSTQNWNMKLGSYATEPIPAIQTHAVSVTTTSVGASTSATGQLLFRNENVIAKTSIKATTNARMYNYNLYNPNSVDVWVHFYNALIANVTVGTTVPVWSVYVPANGGTAEREFTVPLAFATGLSVATTTSLLSNVSTAPTTGALVEVGYI